MIAAAQEYTAGFLAAFIEIFCFIGPLWLGYCFGDRFPEQWKPRQFATLLALLAWLLSSFVLYELFIPSIAILNGYSCRVSDDPTLCRSGDGDDGDR